MNLEHLLHALTNHPDIQSATFGPAPNGLLDWDVITITFTDDTLRLLNVNVAQPTYPGETEAECVERVLKLVFNSEAETVVRESSLTDTLPLVRSADYFADLKQASPEAFAWLTDFIGFGLAFDLPTTLRVVSTQDLPPDHDAATNMELCHAAVANLRALAGEVTLSDIGLGPNILTMSEPAGHELAWFADVATMSDLLSNLRQRTNSEWVVIPARRNQILLVNTESSESEWSTFLDVIEDAFRYHDVVYPVPHIIVDGQWVEPVFDDPTDVGRRLRRLQMAARHQTYEEIPALLREQTGCEMASFEVMTSDIDDSHSVPETYSIAYVDTNSAATRRVSAPIPRAAPHPGGMAAAARISVVTLQKTRMPTGVVKQNPKTRNRKTRAGRDKFTMLERIRPSFPTSRITFYGQRRTNKDSSTASWYRQGHRRTATRRPQ